MALASNNLKRVDMPLNKETKPNHTFPKGIKPKVNARVRQEFEHAYYDVQIQHLSHYATETLPIDNITN